MDPRKAPYLIAISAVAAGYGAAALADDAWYVGVPVALLAGWIVARLAAPPPPDTTATTAVETERAELQLRLADAEVERDAARAELRAAELEIRRRKQVTVDRVEKSTRELREFAFAATHDLQEPLRKIRMFGDLLLEDEAERLSKVGRGHLTRMRQAADHFEGLLDDLLDLHRPEQIPAARRVELGEVLRAATAEHEATIEETGATIEIGELATIEADPIQLRRLFGHLVGNALKFRRPGVAPRVQVQGRYLERPVDGTPCFALMITDNGIGFDGRYVNRIFQLFQRLHTQDAYPGRGIGLTMCRRIVEAHDGAITAQSTPGEGSTFIVTLPINRRFTTLPPPPMSDLLPPTVHRPDSEGPHHDERGRSDPPASSG
ncbi:MAG: hypothetical protein H6701_17415 [Myxococcales bacterium]|nr:hypothetical protein [Myxococcales bacterium]